MIAFEFKWAFLFLTVSVASTPAKMEENTINKFSLQFYKEASNSEKNIIMSPLSVETLLGLLSFGADGDTQKEINDAIHLPNTDIIKSTFKSQMGKINSIQGVVLNIANKIYVKNGERFELAPDFKAVANDDFSSDIENVDFSNADSAANTINNWVDSKTNNKIKNFVSPQSIDPATRVILVNAIYFQGNWEKPFDTRFVHKTKFNKNQNEVIDVDMMYQAEDFLYAKLPEWESEILSLPYKNNDTYLTIILPREINGLKALEEKIYDANFANIFKKMTKREVNVNIPKFMIETTIDLKQILPKLGIKLIFDSAKADLHNLLKSGEQVYISEGTQKAFIEVNEHGTEAAAVTELRAVPTSLNDNIVYFTADRPFFYMLMNKDDILFCGKYLNIIETDFLKIQSYLIELSSSFKAIVHHPILGKSYYTKYLNFFIQSYIYVTSISTKMNQITDIFNQFSLKFYKEAANQNVGKNLIVSPISSEILLGLLSMGAEGDTRKELNDALQLNDSELIKSTFKSTIENINNIRGVILNIANKLYVKHGEGFDLSTEFKNIAIEDFSSDIQNIDFTNTVNAVDTINEWVENQTKSKIHNFVTSDTLDKETRIIMINAIYFQGTWNKKFVPNGIFKRKFNINEEEDVDIYMMYQTDNYPYADLIEWKAKIIALPYEMKEMALVIILPNKVNGLDDLDSKICSANIADVLSKMKIEEVEIGIPKFKIESSIDLKHLLPKLGISLIFKSEVANLKGILKSDENVFISEAKQKAFIEVNEQGTEAGALSEMKIETRMGPDNIFYASHPFFYMLMNKENIIFCGKFIGA
ncbi:uncharacterized protein LOC143912572 [Arctopsyche grandis]|uniref:uncharacterized protein LOC143912572 n=1 Tax=Arctopsyche grandis TaxID=121162 RepID=UPI00406D9076